MSRFEVRALQDTGINDKTKSAFRGTTTKREPIKSKMTEVLCRLFPVGVITEVSVTTPLRIVDPKQRGDDDR